ncbi:hypothetical protein OIDMADRAFT_20355 [Oidiodendron maius Zn]|uniref:Uncharacterized protein n=1 Tax=Oidiodendron maius (strain Zn) TaxID=913774 RepID=A0A0C3GPV0_OIDMZ|nr:hypothetical protein OIDMADRAFT_20355 [Oidiodendron maius Zn]
MPSNFLNYLTILKSSNIQHTRNLVSSAIEVNVHVLTTADITMCPSVCTMISAIEGFSLFSVPCKRTILVGIGPLMTTVDPRRSDGVATGEVLNHSRAHCSDV